MIMRSHKCIKLHKPFACQVAMGPPAGKGKGKGFGGRGHGRPDPGYDKWNHQDHNNMPLNSLGRIRELDTAAYLYFEWKFRLQILEYTTNLWPIIQGGTDDEALELWKDIAHLLEFDATTWNGLMLLVHQGVAGRAEANKLLWDLLTSLCLIDHVQNNNKTISIIGAVRKIIDRPPDGHVDMMTWTYLRAIEPRPSAMCFAAEMVPERPCVITAPGGGPLIPPHCWIDKVTGLAGTPLSYVDKNRKDNGTDNRASRRSRSTYQRTGHGCRLDHRTSFEQQGRQMDARTLHALQTSPW